MFKENFHMNYENFMDIFQLLKGELEPKKYTRPLDNIPPLKKFAAVLEHLASGSLQRHVASVYRISKQHSGTLVDEVCETICKVLKNEIAPLTPVEFVRVANEYNAQWNLPNCVGAIDGKHIAIKCPQNAASLFYNYKGFHSIVLMAIVDANYKFLEFDIGAYGSEGDANVSSATKIGRETLQDKLPFPNDMFVGEEKLPYFFVADDAFPLHKRITKSFCSRKSKMLTPDESVANYRISRARRCVENAFGIMCSKWICLSRTMICNPDRAQKITSACCYLHNYMLRVNKAFYCPSKFADYYDEFGRLVAGEWRKQIGLTQQHSISTSSVGRPCTDGKKVRDALKRYFISPSGRIPWQEKAAFCELNV